MVAKTSVMRLVLKLGALLAFLPLSGCFTYAGAPLDAASPGTQTRLSLSDEGFVRVANQAAMSGFPVQSMDQRRKAVSGRILAVGSNDLSVEIRGIGGAVFTAEVPTLAIQEVAVRSFSKARTIGAIAFGVALSATLGSGVIGGTTGQQGPPPPDNFASIPFISIPFR